MNIQEKPPSMQSHIETLKTKGLYNLGQNVTSTRKKVGFLFAQIFAIFSIIGIIPTFILISRYFKKVALDTIQKDNKDRLDAVFEKTFNKTEITNLYKEKLLPTNQYLTDNQLQAINTHLEGKPQNEPLDADKPVDTPDLTDDANDPIDQNDQVENNANDFETTEDDLVSSDDELPIDFNENDNEVEVSELKTPDQENKTPAEQLKNLIFRSLPSEGRSTDYSEHVRIISEKAAERMTSKEWTAEDTHIRIVTTFGKCLERNKDNDQEKAARHLKEALDPTLATSALHFFNFQQKTSDRNNETLRWLDE